MRRAFLTAGTLFLATGAVVALGVVIGTRSAQDAGEGDWQAALRRFDANHYAEIVERGYFYDPESRSDVAFFPAYPLLVRRLRDALPCENPLFPCRPTLAMLIVSNTFWLAALVLWHRYLAQRRLQPCATTAEPPSADRPVGRSSAFLLLAVFPTTVFLRFPYAESMLLLFALATLLGIERRWPLPLVALLAGAATATRPPGVALLLPVLWDAWRRTPALAARLARVLYAVPLALWGLLAYMGYQWRAFGDPLAFARTQEHWHALPWHSAGDKLVSLISLEPIWSPLLPSHPCNAARVFGSWNPLLNIGYLNMIVFLGCSILVVRGAILRRLTSAESLLALGLLGIPYVTRAYENCLYSHARFATVVFPAYIVLGEQIDRLPRFAQAVSYVACAALLGVYAARFASGAMFF